MPDFTKNDRKFLSTLNVTLDSPEPEPSTRRVIEDRELFRNAAARWCEEAQAHDERARDAEASADALRMALDSVRNQVDPLKRQVSWWKFVAVVLGSFLAVDLIGMSLIYLNLIQ